jgi:hypothetical protein
MTKFLHEINQILSAMSFDQYVLIDCLNTNNLSFVALTKQGFLNLIKDVIDNFDFYALKLYDNYISFSRPGNLCIIIRYTNKNIDELVEMPGLDFYKCYYDGVKMHCTPEAIQCHKTNKVQYVGKINLHSYIVRNIFSYHDFKVEFWKANSDYVIMDSFQNKHTDTLTYNIDFDNSILTSNYFRDFDSFPTKSDVVDTKSSFGSKHMFTLDAPEFKLYEEQIYNFINEIIFENPIVSLS